MKNKIALLARPFCAATMLFFLSSCEHTINQEYWVQNNSTGKISGYQVSMNSDTTLLFLISRGQKLKIATNSGVIGRKSRPCEVQMAVKDLLGVAAVLIRRESDSLYIDCSKIDKWTCRDDQFYLTFE